MRGLLAGAVVLFGCSLALSAYGYQQIEPNEDYAANADAAMTPDSGTSGVGYDDSSSK